MRVSAGVHITPPNLWHAWKADGAARASDFQLFVESSMLAPWLPAALCFCGRGPWPFTAPLNCALAQSARTYVRSVCAANDNAQAVRLGDRYVPLHEIGPKAQGIPTHDAAAISISVPPYPADQQLDLPASSSFCLFAVCSQSFLQPPNQNSHLCIAIVSLHFCDDADSMSSGALNPVVLTSSPAHLRSSSPRRLATSITT
jgi:hypothetical protein